MDGESGAPAPVVEIRGVHALDSAAVVFLEAVEDRRQATAVPLLHRVFTEKKKLNDT